MCEMETSGHFSCTERSDAQSSTELGARTHTIGVNDRMCCFSHQSASDSNVEGGKRDGDTEAPSKRRWTTLTPCGNGRDVSNLVQFVNSASNDIKEAIDKSSPSLSLTHGNRFTHGDKRKNCKTIAEVASNNNIETGPGYKRKCVSMKSSKNLQFVRNAEQTCGASEISLSTSSPRSHSPMRSTENRGEDRGNGASANGTTPGESSILCKGDDTEEYTRRPVTTNSSSSSFARNADSAGDDRRKRYFNSRDSGTSTPLKVLKVGPLNVVKSKSIPEKRSSDYPRDNTRYSQNRSIPVSGSQGDELPNKRPKLSNGTEKDSEQPDVPKSAESTGKKHSEPTPLFASKNDVKKSGEERKSATVNPLPLRKRRLPASFWQEPGKAEKNPPVTPAEPSSRHTAFLPIAPRRSQQSIGRYVKDCLGSNLSASEKLELLRLNSLERENYNHLCASRDSHSSRCSSYPCVLMHCRNPQDNFRISGFAGIPPAQDYHLHSPPGVALAYPTRGPYLPHHDRLPNVLGLSYPSVSPYFNDIFRHDDVIDPSCGSRLVLPTVDPGSHLFPFSSPLHPSIVRPVPKKHLSNISGSFHPLFDVR